MAKKQTKTTTPKPTQKAPSPRSVPKITKEAAAKFMEQIVFENSATKVIEVVEGKLNVTIRTLTARDQLDIEQLIPKVEGTPAYQLHKYAIYLLSKSLLRYGDKNLKAMNWEEKEEFIEHLPTAILDRLVMEQQDFSKQINALLSPDKLEENFFATPST